MQQYDDKHAEVEVRIEQLKSELDEAAVKPLETEKFIALIKKYKNPTEITDIMLRELVDKIVVQEGTGMNRVQQVDIYFNFVGQVTIAYTEAELAEQQAQREQIAAERLARQREREKSYREKRKAKKIAENGSIAVPKKVCPCCGEEFPPTSNRQIFCSKNCRYVYAQNEKKAAREAERGDHYYHQRTRMAAESYGIEVRRNGMACCPFHPDKTPSMKPDARFHCFGCQAGGDVINITARLSGLSPRTATEKLSQDFGIGYKFPTLK